MQEIKVESCLKKHYYDEITLIRGILALLVVLGHITSQFELDGSTESNLLYAIGRVIYSFHMALFFVISGFVSIKSIEFENISDKLQYTKSRFERLMLPYFAMGIIYLPFKIIMGGGYCTEPVCFKRFLENIYWD